MEEEKDENALGSVLQWLIAIRGASSKGEQGIVSNYYGLILKGCSKIAIDSGTAKVGLDSYGKHVFCYNANWFNKLSTHVQILVVIHEAAHIVLGHIPRMLSIISHVEGKELKDRIWVLANIAADLAVNSNILAPIIADNRMPIHELKSEIQLWPSLYGFKDGLSLEEYFDLLLEKIQKEEEEKANGKGKGKEGDNGDSGDSSGDGANSDSDSDGGNPGTSDSDNDDEAKSGDDWVDDAVKEKYTGGVNPMGDYSNMTPEEIERVVIEAKQELKQFIRKAGDDFMKTHGRLPGGIISKVTNEMLTAPTIAWSKVLRDIICNTLNARTIDGIFLPNPQLQDLPGLEPYPGYTQEQSLSVLVGVDTSGSVSDKEYIEFMVEIESIINSKLADVYCVMFDAAIQHAEIITQGNCENLSPQKRRNFRYGYGGTSFTPFLRLACQRDTNEDWVKGVEKFKKKIPIPDLVLLLTDGYAPIHNSDGGPIPSYRPRAPLIWVLTPNGKEDSSMGRTLRITG